MEPKGDLRAMSTISFEPSVASILRIAETLGNGAGSIAALPQAHSTTGIQVVKQRMMITPVIFASQLAGSRLSGRTRHPKITSVSSSMSRRFIPMIIATHRKRHRVGWSGQGK